MTSAALGSTISAVIAGDIVEQLPLLRHPPEQRAGLAKIVGYCRYRQYLDAEEGSFLARAVLRQGEEVRFASDSPLEGTDSNHRSRREIEGRGDGARG